MKHDEMETARKEQKDESVCRVKKNLKVIDHVELRKK